MPTTKEKKFESIFRQHFKELVHHAYKILQDRDRSEEAVQQVFLKFWERDWENEIHTSPRAYLFRSVYNESINQFKQDKVKQRYEVFQKQNTNSEYYELQQEKELKLQLHVALDQLPDKCRTVFELSRFEHLKYQQIADELNISLKTVEGHMSKALRHLRIHLVDYLTILLLTLINGL